jgi:cytochrome c oxidase subunit 2
VVYISLKVLFSYLGLLRPDSEILERTWTIIPIIILLTIVYPRIHLLCLQDARRQVVRNTVKVISNQWNWQRETRDVVDHLLDSEAVDLLAAYETPIILKSDTITRVITISTDVLHSLGIPRLGIKLDAMPARISITILESDIQGSFVGSCYELCGRGHSSIPLHVLCL